MRRIGFLLFLLVSITATLVLQNFASQASANNACASQTYVVQAGDNLGKIAWEFGVSLQTLLDANDLADHTDYYVGQELIIPAVDCAEAVSVEGSAECQSQTYIVQEGDNLGKIAWRFSISVQELIAANNLTDHNDYFIGQQLIIPTAECNSSDPAPFSITYRERFGVTGGVGDAAQARQAGLNFGAYAAWDLGNPSSLLPNVQTNLRVIRLSEVGVVEGMSAVGAAVRDSKGATWVVGNEMDVIWQDNVTPARYASLYHDLYHQIKSQDPTAKVAIGAIATPTPLRRQYLDLVLTAYQNQYGVAMPIDVWTIHTYILREERNSWGAEIPPGMTSINEGTLYEIDDHGDVQEMIRLISEFRGWMAMKGYRNVPLLITEMGILMPADFGFPPEVVAQYMHSLIGYLLNARDAETGYPQDGNLLVQQWYWFSVWDETFAVNNLYDRETGNLTPVGWAYGSYLR